MSFANLQTVLLVLLVAGHYGLIVWALPEVGPPRAVSNADIKFPFLSEMQEMFANNRQTNGARSFGTSGDSILGMIPKMPESFGKIPQQVAPVASILSTPASTSSMSPMEDLAKTIVSLPNQMPKLETLDESAKLMVSLIKASLNVGQNGISKADKAASTVVKATKTTGQVVGTIADAATGGALPLGPSSGPIIDDPYYEYSPLEEPFGYRRPKYFSHDCNFRVACEIAKATRSLTEPLVRTIKSNKFIEDLQNRYTRAMTYGTLYGKCERYYCVFVKFFGGPQQFASAMIEVLNRAANPDLYDGVWS